MKKLKYDSRKKEYTGVAYVRNWLDAQIIVVAPTMAILKKHFESDGYGLDPKLCRKLNVKITKAK